MRKRPVFKGGHNAHKVLAIKHNTFSHSDMLLLFKITLYSIGRQTDTQTLVLLLRQLGYCVPESTLVVSEELRGSSTEHTNSLYAAATSHCSFLIHVLFGGNLVHRPAP